MVVCFKIFLIMKCDVHTVHHKDISIYLDSVLLSNIVCHNERAVMITFDATAHGEHFPSVRDGDSKCHEDLRQESTRQQTIGKIAGNGNNVGVLNDDDCPQTTHTPRGECF